MENSVQRIGLVINLRPEKVQEYKQLHASVWPDVLAQIKASNIRNYTIFLREPENLLFSYFEYAGDDFDHDMSRMAEDKTTREWWTLTDPCQTPLSSCADDEHWAPMENVFHAD